MNNIKQSDFARIRKIAVLKSGVLSYAEDDTGFGSDQVTVTMTGGEKIRIPNCSIEAFENALFGRPQPVE